VFDVAGFSGAAEINLFAVKDAAPEVTGVDVLRQALIARNRRIFQQIGARFRGLAVGVPALQ